MDKRMTQQEMIKKHLMHVETITNIEAAALYKARSLTKVISNLRKAGMNIISEWKTDITKQRYVKYHYRGLV
jgi:hypothetical protein